MSMKESFEKIKSGDFLVEIYGLGYVGFPLAVRLSTNGFSVVGIDVNKERIERLKNDQLMDSELLLKNEFLESRKKGLLELNDKPKPHSNPKIGIICVPTPIPTETTSSDVFVKSAVESFLECSKNGDTVILESSVEVGTTEKMGKIIEAKGYAIGDNFGLCFCPERIDPQNKEWGIENIPRIIYCSDDDSYKISKEVYNHVNQGNLLRVSSAKIAEIVKSFENTFRLVNIALVNELAILCDKLGVNVKEIIDAAATKPFGFMPHYPGAGAGGHCIPKDPRFLLESAKNKGIDFNTIEHALEINQFMPKYIANQIMEKIENENLNKSVLICGLSYKANVEDMRDSPSFKIINELRQKNVKVYGYDKYFDSKFLEKYLIENHLTKFDCEIIDSLEDKIINDIGCLCIVQHHKSDQEDILQIYHKGLIPFIYDCQNKIKKNLNVKTILEFLGD